MAEYQFLCNATHTFFLLFFIYDSKYEIPFKLSLSLHL